VSDIDPSARLVFIEDPQKMPSPEQIKTLLPKPVYINEAMDFAIVERAAEQGFVDITKSVDASDDAILYSYPNGIPLAESTKCKTFLIKNKMVEHDCDSFRASSAGVLVDAKSQSLIGLHRKGSDANDAQAFRENNRFESPDEMAQKYCKRFNLSEEKFQECVAAMRYNKAILFSEIIADLKINAEGLLPKPKS
jgi:hypothetical protein